MTRQAFLYPLKNTVKKWNYNYNTILAYRVMNILLIFCVHKVRKH